MKRIAFLLVVSSCLGSSFFCQAQKGNINVSSYAQAVGITGYSDINASENAVSFLINKCDVQINVAFERTGEGFVIKLNDRSYSFDKKGDQFNLNGSWDELYPILSFLTEAFDDVSSVATVLSPGNFVKRETVPQAKTAGCYHWSKRRCQTAIANDLGCSVRDVLMDCLCAMGDYLCSCYGECMPKQ